MDPNKLVLSGSSAGGWLSLLCGTGIGFKASGLDPPEKGRVKGIAALYPITDLLDPFWTTKQYPVSYFKRIIDKEELGAFLDHKGEKVASSALDSPRNVFYSYMIQECVVIFYICTLGGFDFLPSEGFWRTFCWRGSRLNLRRIVLLPP